MKAYEMVDELRQDDIRARTIKDVQSRYQMDMLHGDKSQQRSSVEQAGGGLEPSGGLKLVVSLRAATKLREIGLTIDFKERW
ncbi:hypothetical protein OK016_08680 [Vibrio chagasii]|nr:hypothetical protein [Vibrio chagasii]